jgi:capsular exopolysaccharide synthesis family protein
MIAAVVLAFIIDNLDPRIFTRDQISAVTTVPILGQFPRLHSHKQSSALLKNEYLLPERDYWILCKKLIAALQNKKARTILVTSANAMEGKSVLTAGIAAGLVENNYKVLVVDANLRWPEQRRLYQITGEQDLNTYLRGESDNLEELIRRNVKPGIDVFPAFSKPNDQVSPLHVNQLKDLFMKLKMYDAILVDSPALLATTDSYNLATIVDAVIIVAQQGHTTTTDVKSICSYLEDLDSKLVGIVINQMPRGTDVNYSLKEHGWWARLKARAERLIPRTSKLQHTH